MNIMMNANDVTSANAGSVAPDPVSQAAAGQSAGNGQAVDYEKSYKELEGKMGKMGSELGEYRNFFQNISPLLEKLDQNPELVQVIVDGKIDKQLVQAVLEGRVDVKDASAVSQANQQVQNEVGVDKIATMSKDQIEKLVEEKAKVIRKEFEEKADLKSFEDKTQTFIEKTDDFVKYAGEIDKWLDKHDVTDIEVAYYAVKGQMSEAEAKRKAEEAAAERAKDYMMNAQGGGVVATTAPDGTPLIDKLVGGSTNPIF